MGIEIKVVGQGDDDFGISGRLYAPVILCDHCGKRIDNASEGAYTWGVRLDEERETFTPIKFFHKKWKNGACALAWERFEREIEQQGYVHQWMDLDDFIVYLANNLPGGEERKKRVLATSKAMAGAA